jgi:hypothetical protein
VKIVREMYNRSKDNWEFLTDDGHMLIQAQAAGNFSNWILYEVAAQDAISEDWNGREVWRCEAKFGSEPETILRRYQREQNSRYECELFADLDCNTKGELDMAYQHIEAGDLSGAFQHLMQFATWAIQEFADVPVVGEVWEKYGPHYGRNGHLHIIYDDELGWQLCDKLNESFYGPLCPACHRPYGQCVCQPPSEPNCERCGHYVSECHCRVSIPF